jgi:hypothetical protein
MTKIAGYGVLVQATQKSMQLALGVYHGAGILPLAFAGTTTLGQTQVAYDLFMDVPRLTLAAATPTPVGVELRLAGRITALTVDRDVLLRVQVTAGVFAIPAIAATEVRFAAADITVLAVQVDPIGGGALPAGLVALVTSPAAVAWLDTMVSAALANIHTIAPPIALPLLDQLGDVQIAGATVRVLDGALAVGIDLAHPSLIGTASQITNQLGKSGLSVLVHPSLVPSLAETARPAITEALVKEDASLESVAIAIESDCFRVTGSINKSGISANFSLLLRPRLGKEDVWGSYDEEYGQTYNYLVSPGHDDIWLEVVTSSLDVDLPWYLYAFGVLLGPLSPALALVVSDIVASATAHGTGALIAGVGGKQFDRVQQVTLPGTQGPVVSFTITMLKVDAEGLRVRSNLAVGGSAAGTLSGPLWIDGADLATDALAYDFSLGSHLFHPLDPTVRFLWQVRRFDTMTVVHTQDLAAAAPGWSALSLVEVVKAQKTDRLVVTCTAVRRFGAVQEKIATDSCTLVISDRLDRSHPYVSWRHQTYSPITQTQLNGQVQVIDYWAEYRKSAIHRTDVPGRCSNAARFSEDAVPQYHDALPFALVDIDFHRDLLCDYCFWGGPDKTELKPLPAQG